MPSVEPVHPGGLFLIEDLVACVREHWNIIPHLHQTQIDQLPQMIWIDRKQCPLGFDVSKRPNEVDGPKGGRPLICRPICHSLHKIRFLRETASARGATEAEKFSHDVSGIGPACRITRQIVASSCFNALTATCSARPRAPVIVKAASIGGLFHLVTWPVSTLGGLILIFAVA